jgi:hypothetical protein
MKNLITIALFTIVGCNQPTPTAPTSMNKPSSIVPAAIMTSRVNPHDFDIDELNGLSLDHNPFTPGVSMCRTMQREYCDAAGSECWWETDYYTVEDPDKCPIEPIP